MSVAVTFSRDESGRYHAEFVDLPDAPIESSSLDGLLDELKAILEFECVMPQTDAEREQQESDDLAAARDRLAEIERGEAVPLPWEQTKAESGR